MAGFGQMRGGHLAGGVQWRHATRGAFFRGGNGGIGLALRGGRRDFHGVDAAAGLGEVLVDDDHGVTQGVASLVVRCLADLDGFQKLHECP